MSCKYNCEVFCFDNLVVDDRVHVMSFVQGGGGGGGGGGGKGSEG